MKIHEFQAKQILREAGVAVLRGHVAKSPEEAARAFETLGSDVAAIKAQIHAGGRGKGTVLDTPEQRGVQLVRSADEAQHVAARLLGREAGHDPNGSRGPDRSASARRGRLRHRPRTVRGDRAGPLGGPAGADGLQRRRRGDREGGGRNAGTHFQGAFRSAGGLAQLPGAQAGSPAGTAGRQPAQCGVVSARPVPGVWQVRLQPGGNQPARRHRPGTTGGARRQDDV